jgi:hypothetical protein
MRPCLPANWPILLTLCLCLLAGCDRWKGRSDDEFADDSDIELTDETSLAPASAPQAGPAATPPASLIGSPPAAATPGTAAAPGVPAFPGGLATAPPAAPSTAGLNVGDRIPLVKTIVQELRQPGPQGVLATHSTLQLTLSLTVEEVCHSQPGAPHPRDGQKRLRVTYHRIVYSQDLAGNAFNYDSSSPPATVPPEMQGYHGLKENGFQFWVGAHNQVLELVAFDQFLERCLSQVPPDQQQQVRVNLAATTSADSIFAFVDDSVGVLPPEPLQQGTTWVRTRQVTHPLPLSFSQKYTISQLTPEMVTLDLQGSLAPVPSQGPPLQGQPVVVSVRAGQTRGNCVIERQTGLPVQGNVEQTLQMQVRLAGGQEFEQSKTTVTTIQRSASGAATARTAMVRPIPGA